MSDALRAVFEPRSVAVIGASQDATKRGYQAVRALLDSGYTGSIYPVNPRGGTLHGLPVARSLAELDAVPDLALVCTPAATVPHVLEQAAAKGIAAAVVLALGFAETGEAGAELEAQVRAVAQRTGMRVVGPNTSGILNLGIGLNLIGARELRAGCIALLLQSGNVALALMNESARDQHEGISICVGAGNETDLGFADYLHYLQHDDATAVIAMYVEGFRNGRAFYDAARSEQRTKPIVLLKGGRSSAGHTAARSHTGAVAGEYAVTRAALRQAGIIEVTRTDELYAVAETLAWQPPTRGAIAVLSDGGGHATLAADIFAELQAPLASLSAPTQVELFAVLGANAGVSNPIDMAGAPDAAPLVFADALRVLMSDKAVGGVLMVGLFGGYAIRFAPGLLEEEVDTARQLATIASESGKTLVVHSLYADRASEPVRVLRAAHVPVHGSLEIACRCSAASAEWPCGMQRRAINARRSPAAPEFFACARRERRTILLEPEARALVVRYGVPVVPASFCTTESQVRSALRESGTAALKLVATSVSHKSAVGGVILNLTDADSAAAAFHEVMAIASDARGVLVSPMLPPPRAEVLVGARRDAQFGPILTLGVGGTNVEIHRAIAIRVLPIDDQDAIELIDETPVGRLLSAQRGRLPVDRAPLLHLILALADCVLANPELAELECNPVFVTDTGAVAVDVRAFLSQA